MTAAILAAHVRCRLALHAAMQCNLCHVVHLHLDFSSHTAAVLPEAYMGQLDLHCCHVGHGQLGFNMQKVLLDAAHTHAAMYSTADSFSPTVCFGCTSCCKDSLNV
jgi:hypothetical protein